MTGKLTSVAVATALIGAVALVTPTPAEAHGGLGVGIAAGLLGGAILGGVIANASPAATRTSRRRFMRTTPSCVTASSSAMNTAIATGVGSATDLTRTIDEFAGSDEPHPGQIFVPTSRHYRTNR